MLILIAASCATDTSKTPGAPKSEGESTAYSAYSTDPSTAPNASTTRREDSGTLETTPDTGSAPAPKDTGDTGSAPKPAIDPCSVLDPKSCVADPTCTPIEAAEVGTYISTGFVCIWPKAYHAAYCRGAELKCTPAEQIAAPNADPMACQYFQSTCLPEGWGPCKDPIINSGKVCF